MSFHSHLWFRKCKTSVHGVRCTSSQSLYAIFVFQGKDKLTWWQTIKIIMHLIYGHLSKYSGIPQNK